MNGYERILTVLKGGRADKVPLMLHAFMPAAAEAGLTMNEYRSSAKNMARALIGFTRKYGLDGILPDVDTCMEAGAVGVPIELPEDAPARVIDTASGDIDRIIEMMEPSCLYKYDRIKIYLEALNIMKNEVGGELLVRAHSDQMAFSLAMIAYGMDDFLADLCDEAAGEKILTLIERAFQVHLEYQRMTIAAGGDMTSFGDSCCSPSLISRQMFQKFSLPFHKRLRAELKKSNTMTLCHICGNIDIILDDVADIGYEAVEIDYKTNLQAAAKAFKGRSTVFGPIDPSGLFFYGTPDRMRAEVRRVLGIFDGGIVLGAGCAIPKGAPEENIRAFVEAARSYGG